MTPLILPGVEVVKWDFRGVIAAPSLPPGLRLILVYPCIFDDSFSGLEACDR